MKKHRANNLLEKACVALDYELTAYWGQVIAVSASYRVTLKYYGGTGIGWTQKEFCHWRVWPVSPYNDDDASSEQSIFKDRRAVKRFFRSFVIPRVREAIQRRK